jgi:plasmid stabilization system protein ParE
MARSNVEELVRSLRVDLPGYEQGGEATLRPAVASRGTAAALPRRAALATPLNSIDLGVATSMSPRRLWRRELVISRTPFIVVYHLPSTQQVEILRLLHGAQLWPPAAPKGKKP